MVDPRQDRALQDLARSIARSVETLGVTCTAQLLARTALAMINGRESGEQAESTEQVADALSTPPSSHQGQQDRYRDERADKSAPARRLRHRTRP